MINRNGGFLMTDTILTQTTTRGNWLEQYLSDNGQYNDVQAQYIEMRYRIINSLGHQARINEFIADVDGEPGAYAKLAVCRIWAGRVLATSARRIDPDEARAALASVQVGQRVRGCRHCSVDECSH
jgi:hypothetical protein